MTGLCAVWDFRTSESNNTLDEIKCWLNEYTKKWCFQLEEGDENGYRHYQGRFSLVKKRQKHVLLKLFKTMKPPNYLEPTIEKEHQKEALYVMKADTRIAGPWRDEFNTESKQAIYLPRQYRDLTLYPYQQKIIDSANVFEPRIINLIYDVHGNNGKSTVAAICEILYNGIDMPPLNDYKEIVQLACNICQDSNNRTPKIMCFDMPRSINKDKLYGLYSAIEQIKKGKLYDIRHHYKAFWIDSPQIWVFTNELPLQTYLSSDRWKIWQINEQRDLVPYIDNFIEL